MRFYFLLFISPLFSGFNQTTRQKFTGIHTIGLFLQFNHTGMIHLEN